MQPATGAMSWRTSPSKILRQPRLMNENFVSIKVDREERPDLDSIYMNAVVAMTGQGGWPMSVFLTPDGTAILMAERIFHPVRRYGMPSFREMLHAVCTPGNDDSASSRSSWQRN